MNFRNEFPEKFILPDVFSYGSILVVRLSVGLHGQAVKTSPFHGGNTGSIPVGVILVFAIISVYPQGFTDL